MAITLVQSNEGSASASATVAWGFSGATTAGNLIVGCIAADDYNGTPDSGWTQSSEMEQQLFHGGYLWWRISTGETNPQAYTIGSASKSVWILLEFSGIDSSPYDTSQGKGENAGSSTYTSDAITPSTGERLLVAMFGASDSGTMAADTVSFSDSFTLVREIGTALGGTEDFCAVAYRTVTGDGATSFTTTGTFSNSGVQSRSSLVAAFKGAVGGSPIGAAAYYYSQL